MTKLKKQKNMKKTITNRDYLTIDALHDLKCACSWFLFLIFHYFVVVPRSIEIFFPCPFEKRIEKFTATWLWYTHVCPHKKKRFFIRLPMSSRVFIKSSFTSRFSLSLCAVYSEFLFPPHLLRNCPFTFCDPPAQYSSAILCVCLLCVRASYILSPPFLFACIASPCATMNVHKQFRQKNKKVEERRKKYRPFNYKKEKKRPSDIITIALVNGSMIEKSWLYSHPF